MDVKLIESNINDRGEQMYLLIFEHGEEVDTLKLNGKELKKLSKKTFSLVNDNIK
jgi:hypothetical protein